MDTQAILAKLQAGLQSNATAIRFSARLLPVGGAGDKVFPPTYKHSKRDEAVYATEKRLIDGKEVDVVLLDSVQSQANRIEAALLDAVDREDLAIPVLGVKVGEYGRISSLDAPHRVYDAIFRDSRFDGARFRESVLGQRLMAARVQDATALYEYCPTVLILGGWDSHARNGGRGAKFARALTSEIWGLNATPGVRTSSRIDPLGITRDAGPIYEAQDPAEHWTLESGSAVQTTTRGTTSPSLLGDGRSSEIGHSNIVPTIVPGGVTLTEARQVAVLSLPQLRRLRFSDPSTDEYPNERDTACRLVLATLALCGLALQLEMGYDLRSRCLLVPAEPPCCVLLGCMAQEHEPFEFDADSAKEALKLAVEEAKSRGVEWHAGWTWLEPEPKLIDLVKRSIGITAPGAS